MNRILSPFPSNKLNSFDLRRLFELTRFPSKALNLASYFNSDYIETRTKSAQANESILNVTGWHRRYGW